MEVTIKVSDKLTAEARAHGLSVEAYVQNLLAQRTPQPMGEERLHLICGAIERIRSLRKGNKLANLRTKDLIHEGHKY